MVPRLEPTPAIRAIDGFTHRAFELLASPASRNAFDVTKEPAHLRDAYGLDVKLVRRGARQTSVIQFTTAATTAFQQIVAPFVPPSMERKLLPGLRGRCTVVPDSFEA